MLSSQHRQEGDPRNLKATVRVQANSGVHCTYSTGLSALGVYSSPPRSFALCSQGHIWYDQAVWETPAGLGDFWRKNSPSEGSPQTTLSKSLSRDTPAEAHSEAAFKQLCLAMYPADPHPDLQTWFPSLALSLWTHPWPLDCDQTCPAHLTRVLSDWALINEGTVLPASSSS